ncbi:type I phosphomannose isomerase catalytic subunit [Spiroplasma monobiae]|uniref:Mannose-6-phosphate isomerase n=1 Tax=Spiroplasma monobiae MQ-1 TaxID=1336748 RepID=A0A2K9LWG3_SPISQ|nr:type I phosphomannose isomerase catalytic subunit [Spiroplasma monobiae]AUM62735.1 mannose-6-phosphate isomerase [Spiroplasma monobiae MQ-1]
MDRIIKIKPFFSERIWGGEKLREFGFDIPKNNIGEAWVISAHENGMSYLEGENISFKDFYEKNKDIFCFSKEEQYPLLTKIITANDFLSVQVHPNDEYAKNKHNSLGKPESWYILDCPENAKLIYGHKAESINQFKEMVKNGEWNNLLKEVEINKGDFLYVEPGKIHAITPGVTVYEIQRSSDITYRLYDYDRIDNNGKSRELHIEDSLKNVSIPDTSDVIIRNNKDLKFDCEYFSLEKVTVDKEKVVWKCNMDLKWYQFTVIKGKCLINDLEFKLGDSAFCIKEEGELTIEGESELLISWINL